MERETNLHGHILEERLRSRRREELYAYGEGQAREVGIKEEDVDRIIHEFREEDGPKGMELTWRDRMAFVRSLSEAPASPNNELRKAAERYVQIFPGV